MFERTLIPARIRRIKRMQFIFSHNLERTNEERKKVCTLVQNPFNENNFGQPFNPFFPPPFDGPGPGPGPGGPPPFGGPGPWGPPPFGGPGQGPGQGPGPGAPSQMPGGPPPNFSPMMSASQAGSNGINRCLFRNTFIWLRNGESFWFFPTFVSRDVISGFRWGRFGWTFRRVNRDSILTFQCF